jgi:hypothetical protein
MSAESNKAQFIRDCVEFLYITRPNGNDERYIFTDAQFRGKDAFDRAYKYASDLLDKKLIENVKAMFREEYGYNVAKEVREISWVYGPEIKHRHYRITLEAIDGVESVSDYVVTFDDDWQVTTCDEYNRVI